MLSSCVWPTSTWTCPVGDAMLTTAVGAGRIFRLLLPTAVQCRAHVLCPGGTNNYNYANVDLIIETAAKYEADVRHRCDTA